jgi:hypothetical protein
MKFRSGILLGFLALCAPSAQAGTLTLTPSVSSATVNLTSVGAVDWASWNATTSLTPTNRKSGGGSTISVTDANAQGSYSNDARTITWSDGTPNGSGSETAGIYDSTTTGGGYAFVVTADTTARIAYFYLALFNATTTSFACSLSDSSASPQSYTGFTTGAVIEDGIVQVNYSANSTAQTLNCLWSFSVGSGSVNIQAVATALGSSGAMPGPQAQWPPIRISRLNSRRHWGN